VRDKLRWQTRAKALATVVAGLGLTWAAQTQAQADNIATAPRGAQLYDGRLALTGQLRGHDQALPADALRCSNCHEPSRQPAQDDAGFAPRLDRAQLTDPQTRRGGPATRYDEAAFCRLLRVGIDPGQVLVRKAMPQYTLTAEDCNALWLHLSQRQ
jgi:hypothetical protein